MDFPSFPPQPTEHAKKLPWLEGVVGQTASEYRAARTRGISLAWGRFISFIALPIGGYYYISEDASWGPVLAAMGLIVFALLVRTHQRAQRRGRALHFFKAILAESQQRLEERPVIIRSGQRSDDESVWRDLANRLDGSGPICALTSQEIGDLDLFGEPLSLYGLLNRTSSSVGASRLAHVLTHPCLSVDAILIRQDAARWMATHPGERMRLMAGAAGMRPLQKECAKLYRTIRDAAPMPARTALGLIRLWGLAGPLALTLGIANQAGWSGLVAGWLPFITVLIINAVLIQLFLKPMREHIRPWLDLDTVVAALRFFAETGLRVLPGEGLLGEQRRRLRDGLGPGCLPTLERRIPLLFLGLSGFMHTIIDLLVFWDLQVLGLMEACYIKHRGQLIDVIAALGECEWFASLGSLAWEEPDVCWPRFASGACHLDIVGGRHPLIAPDEAVRNSLRLGGDVRSWIITGSNMSGKSTFLRMAATNVLLAQIGAVSTAERISLTPLEVVTDLRIRDTLSRKESYFLAEVRQVRRMVDAARSNRPVFSLIDEPFRGTNSAERVAAATAVITALIEGSGLHLVATHDAALTSLGETDGAANYHFCESFDREKLVFDYELQAGPARSRNALRVLEAEGYPANLVQQARRCLSQANPENLDPHREGRG